VTAPSACMCCETALETRRGVATTAGEAGDEVPTGVTVSGRQIDDFRACRKWFARCAIADAGMPHGVRLRGSRRAGCREPMGMLRG